MGCYLCEDEGKPVAAIALWPFLAEMGGHGAVGPVHSRSSSRA